MISLPIAFIAFVIGFGFLVFIHELGHFLVAKWVGIRCTQFAIGFGPAMVSWRKGLGLRVGSTEPAYFARAADRLKQQGIEPDSATQEQALAAADELGLGETEYRLNYLPLGGYVKMMGQEDLDAAAQSHDPRAYNNKSVGARFAVISAGVIMNLITGVVFFVVAFMAGVEFPPAVVGGVDPAMPAAHVFAAGHEDDPAYRGLRVGDRISHIDGEPITDLIAVKLASALGAAHEPVQLTVEREGEARPLIYRITPKPDPTDHLLALGIRPPHSTAVGLVQTNAEVYEGGLRAGMTVVRVGETPVGDYADYYHALTARHGRPTPVTFADPDAGESVSVELAAVPRLPENEAGIGNIAGLVPAAAIPRVVEGSPAEKAGIRAGDLLAEIDGEAWPHVERVSDIVKAAQGRPLSVVVMRDGQLKTIGPVTADDGRIGIMLAHAEQPIIADTLPGTPAATLNLPGGSVLRSVNGTEVGSWADVMRVMSAIDASGGPAPVSLGFELNLAERPVEQARVMVDAQVLRHIGRSAWLPPPSVIFDRLLEPVAADTPWEATVLGVEKTQQFIMQAYVMLLRLVQGTVEVEHLRGPAGILYEGTKIARGGWSYLFYFLGLLSVNLAVINFLPIPIVDGGHAVFLIAEKIKGSPVSPKIQMAAMYVGLVLIGGVFLLVTYHDLRRMVPFF